MRGANRKFPSKSREPAGVTGDPGRRRADYTRIGRRPSVAAQLRLGLLLVALPVVLYCISLFMPHGLTTMDATARLQPPSTVHPFGTDNFGRDIFVRAMGGFPVTLGIAGATIFIGGLVGLLAGTVAGYYGGIVDYWIGRLSDVLLSIPTILMGLLFVTISGGGIRQVIAALGLMFIPSFTKVVRAAVMEQRGKDNIQRQRLMGSSNPRILVVHIWPRIAPQLLAASAVGFANAILAESSLSFLGLGVPASAISWGRMLKDAQGFLFAAPWYALAPGLLIVILVLGIFFIGRALKGIR